jgi:hypothetical protein
MNHQGTTVERQVVVQDNEAHEIVRKQSAAYQPSDTELSLARLERFRFIGNWIIGCIAFLLGARIILSLFAANPAAGFTQLVNALTAPLVLPFTAIFGVPSVGASVVDTGALVAIIVYPIIGYGIISLMKAVLAPADPSGRAYQ